MVSGNVFPYEMVGYSNLTFQIQGRVCLAGLLVFGLGGLAFVYLIRPALERLLGRLSLHSREILCMILLGIFLIDLLWSFQNPNQGAGISKPVIMAAKGTDIFITRRSALSRPPFFIM